MGRARGYRATQIADWLYQKRVNSFEAMTDLPQRLREELARNFRSMNLEIVRVLGSKDTTQKFLFRLGDGNLIESVLIPASPALYGERSDRRTICVSTQVGCAYGCKFCASGLDGFSPQSSAKRNRRSTHRDRARERRKDRQRRLYGHGRTAGEFRQRHARDSNHQRAMGTRHWRAPYHRFDERTGAANPPARRRATSNPSGCFAARRHR